VSQLSHAQFPLRRHPNLLVDHRRSRSAAVAEPRGVNGEAVTGSGGRLHFGMVAGIKSERWPTSNRNPRPDCLGIRTLPTLSPSARGSGPAFGERDGLGSADAFAEREGLRFRVRRARAPPRPPSARPSPSPSPSDSPPPSASAEPPSLRFRRLRRARGLRLSTPCAEPERLRVRRAG